MMEDNYLKPEEHPLKKVSKTRACLLLFYYFLNMSTFVLGGGYAIILASEKLFVHKLNWLKEQELHDGIVLFQTVPGLIAGNVAVYIGYKSAGFLGALSAVIGVALPSIVVILLLSVGFSYIPIDNIHLNGAFIGARSALTAFIIITSLKLLKNVKINLFWILNVTVCFLGVTSKILSPELCLLIGAIFGLSYSYISKIKDLKKLGLLK